MNGLEIFAIIVIAFIFYFLVSGIISVLATDDSNMFGEVAWIVGGLLFMGSAVAWALKVPFPL